MRWSSTVLVGAVLAAAALCLLAATAAASTVRFLSDAELIARADRVVHGSVTGQRVVRVGPGVIYTISTLAVIEDLTGVAGDSVEVWERGGTVGNESMSVAGGVHFGLGEEVVVCLKNGAAGLHTLGMGMAKFDLEPAGAGERQLIRRLADTLVIGGTPARRGLSLREFRQLAAQVTGRTPRPARRSEALETPAVSPEPFTYRGARWLEADVGTAVRYYVNSPAPSPLLGGASPAGAVQTALAAWTNPAAASVILQYFGTTSQPASNGPWNGIPAKSVVISFEDPDGEIDDPVLAITYSFTSTGTGGTVNGTRFDGYTRAAIKFQNAVDLPASYRQTLDFSRIITHEVGHSIGLSHTQTSGAVLNPTANIMYASCCYAQTPTPPALGVDDLAGLVYLYPTDRSCNYSVTPLSAPYAAAGGSGTVQLTTYTSCSWTAASNSPFVTLASSSSGFGPTVLFYNVAANAGAARSGTLVVAGQTVTITQSAPLPAMTVDRPSLSFAAATTAGGFAAQPAAQMIQLTQAGGAPVSWVTTPTQPWLQVSPASGAGSAALVVSVVSTGTLPDTGALNGSIVLSYNGASTSTATIAVTLTLTRATSAAPFGVVDTPLENTSGVTGAVPFTGWALDDGEVAAVSLCRHPVAGEAAAPDGRCGGAAQIYVADALFVEGARPDVQAAFPAYPRSSRGGWGAMVLTNMLPTRGNGTYVFTIYAQDRDGHVTLLGTRTMSCSNLTASLPFGTIDTPGQGETVSGNAYVNFGWALTQTPKAIPTDGSTLTVYVDGVMLGHPSYDHYRADIASLFPGLSNSNGAVGFWLLDTTTLSNGLHTMVWTATDSAGYTQGLGSRYFTVANGTAITAAAPPPLETAPVSRPGRAAALAAAPLDTTPVAGRRGWDPDAPWQTYSSGENGRVTVDGEELDRVELSLGGAATGRWSGFLRVGNELAALPVGSRLDPATGIFTWSPGVGFIGSYDLVFVFESSSRATRQDVRIILRPKASGLVGAHVVIDAPTAQQDAAQPFLLAGWAADLDARVGTGIGPLHVWAYPLSGGAPQFLGQATRGGARPDVAAVYGSQFRDSGYGLVVRNLAPGNYAVAVFAWSAAQADFLPAAVVRVTVR